MRGLLAASPRNLKHLELKLGATQPLSRWRLRQELDEQVARGSLRRDWGGYYHLPGEPPPWALFTERLLELLRDRGPMTVRAATEMFCLPDSRPVRKALERLVRQGRAARLARATYAFRASSCPQ